MRGLAAGEKDFEKYKKLFATKFVFLNVYTTSVQAEHDPRGPEGPYRFQDRSVPVLVFKRWDGKTLVQQLGFIPQPEQAKKSLANFVDKALKENGPVAPPKALRPLLKAYDKGMEHLEKGRASSAIREFRKVLKGAANPKKFPEAPDVAKQAEDQLAKLAAEAERLLGAAGELDADAARKSLKKIQRDYGALPGVKDKVKAALAALKEG